MVWKTPAKTTQDPQNPPATVTNSALSDVQASIDGVIHTRCTYLKEDAAQIAACAPAWPDLPEPKALASSSFAVPFTCSFIQAVRGRARRECCRALLAEVEITARIDRSHRFAWIAETPCAHSSFVRETPFSRISASHDGLSWPACGLAGPCPAGFA